MLYQHNGINRYPPKCSIHPLHSIPCPFCDTALRSIVDRVLSEIDINKEKECSESYLDGGKVKTS